MVAMFNDAATGDFGVLIMLRDVTAERRLGRALKEEFFQSAAHDLRAPLFAIQGYLRLLRKSLTPDERQTVYLESIDQSCEKLTLFVKDALDSARIENGHLRIAPGPVDARALARRTVSLFQPLADERGIALEIRIAADAPSAFEADERLIERLLHNLVANALKFTPRGGRVTVQAASRGDHLEFAVEDDGPGIPADQRAAIFERFRQLDSAEPEVRLRARGVSWRKRSKIAARWSAGMPGPSSSTVPAFRPTSAPRSSSASASWTPRARSPASASASRSAPRSSSFTMESSGSSPARCPAPVSSRACP